ncbi:DUF308 domain-containing protein [Limosilactobacillus difficilis]|uniref:DUF308 domain-containing protein n=1 Tax=Limosilactobacillus difficilis TaxID=2991838 RepID=UPI0024BAABD2|nr:DUF308 domain-containing protein [Limosilactobacillus difficilis]
MIFLALFGGLMLILSGFYLANSWMEYRTWKWPTFMVIISLAMLVIGIWRLPVWHNNQRSASSSSQSSQQTTRSSLSSFSNQQSMTTNNGQSQNEKEMYILRQLQKGYSKMGDVQFVSSTKTYQIKPTNSESKRALNYLVQNPDQGSQIGWSNLTKSLRQTSSQIEPGLGSGYSISLMKPGSSKTVLYTVKDGKTTYDFTQK